MALTNCPECGEMISDTSNVCVHCGYKLNDRKSKGAFRRENIVWIVAALLTGFVLLKNGILVYFFSSPLTGAMLVGQILFVAAIWVLALVVYIVIKLLAR